MKGGSENVSVDQVLILDKIKHKFLTKIYWFFFLQNFV